MPTERFGVLPMSDETPVGYAEAMEELEAILGELEADSVDVDHLAEKVARAAELIELCRNRIESARMDVSRIVGDLTSDS